MTWQTGAAGDEIDTRVFDASGNPVSSAQIVAAGGNSAEAAQTIALSNGGYAVLYQENDAGDENVYVGLFNADGTPASAPVEVDIPVGGVSNFLSDTLKSFDATEHNQIVRHSGRLRSDVELDARRRQWLGSRERLRAGFQQ